MLTRAVNGFTEAEIKAALRGENRPPEFRVRFELRGFDNTLIRELENIWLEGSEITHNTFADVKTTARFRVVERKLVLDPYAKMVKAAGPLFYWRLGESSGSTANDSSGNGRAGTITNAAAYSEPSLLGNAQEDTAIRFSTTKITIADAAWMDITNQATWECWIKTTASGGGFINIASRDNTVLNQSWQLRLSTNGFIQMVLWSTTDTVLLAAPVYAGAVNDGLPHHVVVTYDNAWLKCFLDSVLVGKAAVTGTIKNSSQLIEVGSIANGAGNFFVGVVDEFAHYARALSSTEIREHYQAGSGDLAEIDYFRDRIKPYVAIRMDRNGDDGTPWAEYPRYVFLLEAPARDSGESTIIREVDGFDQTVILKNNKTTARYKVASGTNYITAISAALTAAGLDVTGYQLTPTSSTLPAAVDWPIATPYIRIVNDLLGAINYRGFRFDSNGLGVAEPYVLPAARASEYTYQTDSDSVVLKGIQSLVQTVDVPNVVVCARANPDTATITSTQTNNKVASPTSVPRRGFSIVHYEEVADAADQTALDNIAKRRLTELSQVLHHITFSTWLHPFHDDLDKITFIDQGLGINGDFIHIEWRLPLNEIERMVHRARLSVNVI